MVRFFRRNQQIFIVFIIFYCALIIFGNYIFFQKDINSTEFFTGATIFYFFDISFLSKIPAIVFTFITFFSLIFIGFFLVRLSINHLITQIRTQFPAFFVIVISTLAFQTSSLLMALFGAIFILIAFNRIIGTLENPNLNYRYVDSGILLALGSMFYTNILFFIPFFWISQAVMKKINGREIIYTIIGMLIPYLYLLSAAYILNYSTLDILVQMYYSIFRHIDYDYSWQMQIIIGIYLCFVIIASIFAVLKFSSKKIQSRKLYQLLFYLFIISLAVYLFLPSSGNELFIIISIPTSVLFSIYFGECKSNLINDILLSLLLISPIFLIFSKLIF